MILLSNQLYRTSDMEFQRAVPVPRRPSWLGCRLDLHGKNETPPPPTPSAVLYTTSACPRTLIEDTEKTLRSPVRKFLNVSFPPPRKTSLYSSLWTHALEPIPPKPLCFRTLCLMAFAFPIFQVTRTNFLAEKPAC